MIALDNLDEVIALIRASKSPKEAKISLMDRFSLSEEQAQAILDMRLQRLTNLEIIALRKEYEDILKLISRLEGILKSEKKLLAVIRSEMLEIAGQYTDPRRTTLETQEDTPVEMPEETPVSEDVILCYTRGGYLKRISPLTLKRIPLPTPEESMEESPRFLFRTNTAETLFILTSHGNCYPIQIGKLQESRPRDRGQLLSGVLADIEDGENALLMFTALPAAMEKMPNLVFVTTRGIIKRTAAAEYAVRSRKFPAVSLKKEDQLLAVQFEEEAGDFLLLTRQGMSIRFSPESVPVQGRIASGVRGMTVDSGDEVCWFGQLHSHSELIMFSDRGWAKRIPQSSFEQQNRSGKGVHCFPFNKNGSNGRYIAGACVTEEDSSCTLLVTQVRSPFTRLGKDEILLQNRQGKGMPYIMAILDDVITGLIGVESDISEDKS